MSNDKQRAAYLLLLMKISQLNPMIAYERTFITELSENKEKYRLQIEEEIERGRKMYEGVSYSQYDVRNYLVENEKITGEDIVLIDPPAFRTRYDKMFPYERYIQFSRDIQYNFALEFGNNYYSTVNSPAAFIWCIGDKTDVPDFHVIYAKQWDTAEFSYIAINSPELLGNFSERYHLQPKKENEEVVQFKLMPADHEFKETDVMCVMELNKPTALYYRDLFAHRLGATQAEIYFGIFCNGALMSVCGFNTSFLRRLQETYIFENFCFSVTHNKIENLNRLGMLCLTSGSMYQYLVHKTLRGSAYVQLKTFRTVCLTKYRKSKLNNGLLTLLSSVKQENGTYKLVYEQPFYIERDYSKCLKIFLEKDMRVRRTKEDGIVLESLKNIKID